MKKLLHNIAQTICRIRGCRPRKLVYVNDKYDVWQCPICGRGFGFIKDV